MTIIKYLNLSAILTELLRNSSATRDSDVEDTNYYAKKEGNANASKRYKARMSHFRRCRHRDIGISVGVRTPVTSTTRSGAGRWPGVCVPHPLMCCVYVWTNIGCQVRDAPHAARSNPLAGPAESLRERARRQATVPLPSREIVRYSRAVFDISYCPIIMHVPHIVSDFRENVSTASWYHIICLSGEIKVEFFRVALNIVRINW